MGCWGAPGWELVTRKTKSDEKLRVFSPLQSSREGRGAGNEGARNGVNNLLTVNK